MFLMDAALVAFTCHIVLTYLGPMGKEWCSGEWHCWMCSPSLLVLRAVSLPTAIEAMKNAHREEMERELEKSQRSQISSINSDIEALRRQYL